MLLNVLRATLSYTCHRKAKPPKPAVGELTTSTAAAPTAQGNGCLSLTGNVKTAQSKTPVTIPRTKFKPNSTHPWLWSPREYRLQLWASAAYLRLLRTQDSAGLSRRPSLRSVKRERCAPASEPAGQARGGGRSYETHRPEGGLPRPTEPLRAHVTKPHARRPRAFVIGRAACADVL